MSFPIDDFFRIYRFPTGRLLYLARAFHEALVAEDGEALTKVGAQLLEAADEARRLETGYREHARSPLFGPDAPVLDTSLDRWLVDFALITQAIARSFGEDTPRGRAAAHIHRELFSRGVGEITSLPYVSETATVDSYLTRLSEGGDLAPDVATLGLGEHVQGIRAANDALKAEMDKRAEGASWDEIRAARARANHLLVQAVARVLGRYTTDSPQDEAARERLLGKLWTQQQILAQNYRNKRGTTDVNPDTGVETAPAFTPTEPAPALPTEPA